MIKNILNVNGVKTLTKEEQLHILGGEFINCKKFTVNGNRYIECYDTDKEAYVIFNMTGGFSDCDEIYNH